MAKVKKRKNVGSQVKNIATFKYKKFHHKSLADRTNFCNYYPSAGPAAQIFGLQFKEAGFLHFTQWKSLVDTVRKAIKGKARMRLHMFCDAVARKKKTGIRMGKGKGSEVLWVKNIRPGSILMSIPNYPLANEVLRAVGKKSPLATEVIKLLI